MPLPTPIGKRHEVYVCLYDLRFQAHSMDMYAIPMLNTHRCQLWLHGNNYFHT